MEGDASSTVCVTGATGYIGSWLVKKLLEKGYSVRATVRDPGNLEKVKILSELPNAGTHLTFWKANLIDEGSFDEALDGCIGVFHVAHPMNILTKDPENEMIKPAVHGVENIMRSCVKAKTDMYFTAKTLAEKAALELATKNNIDIITIIPPLVLGSFLTPTMPSSLAMSLGQFLGIMEFSWSITQLGLVHLDDLCDAQIFLMENNKAQGRYICSSHCPTVIEIAKILKDKYPEYNVPTQFEGVDENLKAIPYSSKKLLDIGFKFTHSAGNCSVGDLFAEAIEACKEKKKMIPLQNCK